MGIITVAAPEMKPPPINCQAGVVAGRSRAPDRYAAPSNGEMRLRL